MKALARSRRRDAIVLAALLVGGAIAPVVLSGPQETLDDLFGLGERQRATVEEALGSALANLDPVQAQLDATLQAIEQARDDLDPGGIAANFFLDQNFEDGEGADRIGGWGDWFSAGTATWRPDSRPPFLGEQGYGFWDGNGRYPIGTTPLDAYFVSPRISLRALPVEMPDTPQRPPLPLGEPTTKVLEDSFIKPALSDVPTGTVDAAAGPDAAFDEGAGALAPVDAQTASAEQQCLALNLPACPPDAAPVQTVRGLYAESDAVSARSLDELGLAPALGDPHRVQLHVNHRFNLASTIMGDIRRANDGGRILVFYCASAAERCGGPTTDDLQAMTEGEDLRPALAVFRPDPHAQDRDQYQPVDAFDGGPGFGGANQAEGDSMSTFDLTPLAGRDVWIVFQAATTAKGQSANSFFAASNNPRFDLSKGFGWTLNQVHVDGPAWARNLRFDELLVPAYHVGDTTYKAAEGPNEFSVLLLNRGRLETATLPVLEVQDQAAGGKVVACTPEQEEQSLLPGEVKRIVFDSCETSTGTTTPLELVAGHDYTVAFAAAVDADGDDADNRLRITVKAEKSAAAVLKPASLALSRSAGDDVEPRTLEFSLLNPGLGPAFATARLQARWRDDPSNPVWMEDPTAEGFPAITYVPKPSSGLIGTSLPVKSQQMLRVPVGTAGTPGELLAGWTLVLPSSGQYEFTLNVTQATGGAPATVVDDAVLRASTLLSQKQPYENDFGGKLDDGIVEGPQGSPWREWTVEQMYDVPPPQCDLPVAARPIPCPVDVLELSGLEEDPRAAESSMDPVTDVVRPSVPCVTGVNTVCPFIAHEGDGPSSNVYVVVARPDVTPEAIAAQQSFSRLRVDVQHALQDYNAPYNLAVRTGEEFKLTISIDALAYSDSGAHDPNPSPSAGAPWATRQPLHMLDLLRFDRWANVASGHESPHRARYLDGQWTTLSREVAASAAGSYSAAELGDSSYTAAQLASMALSFRMALPTDVYSGTTRTNRGCPGIPADGEPPGFCPTWRIGYARLQGLDVADGQWKTLALWDGIDADMKGTWESFTELKTGKATTCALATLPSAQPVQCAGFHRRPVQGADGLVARPATALREFTQLPQVTSATGFWANFEPQPGIAGLNYRGDQHLLLQSPALRVPPAAGGKAASLEFAQIYRFSAWSWNQPGSGFEATEAVTLMVRKLENTGSDIVPTTPFLPVYAVPANHPTASGIPLTGIDRAISYRTQSAATSVAQPFIGSTAPLKSSFDLSRLWVLDYRNSTPLQPDADRAAVTSFPPDLPDPQALGINPWDLTGNLVQFAFRLDAGGSDAAPDPCLVNPHNGLLCDQRGWLLDSFAVTEDSKKPYNVEVTAASLHTDGYDWQALGRDGQPLNLGPGTTGHVDITVRNIGLYQVKAARAEVLFIRDGVTTSCNTCIQDLGQGQLQGLSLAPGVSGTVSIPVTIPGGSDQPEAEGNYVVAVRLRLRDIPGQPAGDYFDDDRIDNCAVLDGEGGHLRKPCDALDSPESPAIKVQAKEDLEVDLTVTPLAGRVRFGRNIDVQVQNLGNVVVEGAKLTFGYRNLADPSDTSEWQWTLKSAKPGGPVSWGTARQSGDNSRPDDGTNLTLDGGPAQGRIRLLQTARYLVTATVTKDSSSPALESVDSVLAASYDNFYSDDFAGGLDSQYPGIVSGALQASANWTLETSLNDYQDPTCCAWHFGSLRNGTYPNGADDTLLFPEVDLSIASKAVFSFAHREDLEDGYDGARLEATTDGGGTWLPLTPASGECPAKMTLLPGVGQRTCAVEQVAGTCPVGAVTGSIPVTVGTGAATVRACAIPPASGTCPVGTVARDATNTQCFVAAGYGGILQASNPLNAGSGSDPTNLVGAFTGNSRARAPLQEGWRISEFDLAQIPGFTVPVEVTRLRQDDYPSYTGDEGAVTSMTEWCEPGFLPSDGVDGEHCWQRDNLNHLQPGGDPEARYNGGTADPDDKVLWSGASEHNPDTTTTPPGISLARLQRATTVLTLDIPAIATCATSGQVEDTDRCLGQDDRYQLVFWYWGALDPRSPGQSDPRLQASFAGQCTEQFLINPAPSAPTATMEGWRRATIHLQAANRDSEAVRQVTFTYIDDDDGWGLTSFYTPAGAYSFSTFGQTTFCNKPLRGMALDDVRVEVYAPDNSGDPVPYPASDPRKPIEFPPDDPAWLDSTSVNSADGKVKWTAVRALPEVSAAWNPRDVADDRGGEPARVWTFGNAADKRYPSLAKERLLTPAISLREVGGSTATLSFWERYDTNIDMGGRNRQGFTGGPFFDRRTVLVQSIEPDAEGSEAWGPWTSIGQSLGVTRSPAACAATVQNQWCPVTLDVSTLIGKKVRFAFEIETGRKTPPVIDTAAAPALDPDLGLFWMVDQVGITASTLAGGPVQLRLRVGTDESVGDGGLSVDNPQLVGFPYTRNLAVLTDTGPNLFGSPGETLHLDGIVRNLAGTIEPDVVLQARTFPTATCAGGAPGPLGPKVADRAALGDVPAGATTAQTENFTLTPAGTRTALGVANDRARFAFDLPVPDADCQQFTYRVELRLLRQTETGLTPIDDNNLGDHARDLTLTVDATGAGNKAEIAPGTKIVPLTADLEEEGPQAGQSEPIHVRVPVRNFGTTLASSLAVRVVPTRTPLDGSLSVPTDPILVDVPAADLPTPGQTRYVEFEWRAPASGFYRLDATLTGTFATGPFNGAATTIGHVLVGQSALYWSDDLEGDVSGWESLHAASKTLSTCPGAQDPSSNGPPPANAPEELGWHLTQSQAFDGTHSWFVGTPDAVLNPYPASREETLTTPLVNLKFLRDVATDPNNPFIPDLTFRAMAMLGDASNNGMVVEATAWDGELATAGVMPWGGRTLATACPNPLAPLTAFTGQAAGVWKSASIREGTVPGAGALAGKDVTNTFRFGSGDTRAVGLYIDSLAISAYRATVTPARHDAILATGAEKTFYFRVQNTGVGRDTFVASLDEAATQPEAFLTGGPGGLPLIPIDIATPPLLLEPGESGVVAVRVRVPSDAGLPPITAGDIVVRVASTVDPNQVATGTVHVDRLDTTDLPHLTVQLSRPDPDEAIVDEQEPVSFLAVVRNDGRAPARATDLVVLACPGKAENDAAQDLQECLQARRNGARDSDHWPIVLKSTTIPALPSPYDVEPSQLARTIATKPVSWIPPIGGAGIYRILAIADGREQMRQYEPRSIGQLDLEVRPLSRPDVAVTVLYVEDQQGNAVQEAFEGDLLRVGGTVTNLGNIPAHDVQATLSAQTELISQHIGTLQPGETRSFGTTWVVPLGTHPVALQAYTTTPLDDLNNNALRIQLAVRLGLLEVEFGTPRVDLSPGGALDVTLRLANRRDAAVHLLLPVEPPAGVTLDGLPATLDIPRGGEESFVVHLAASPFAPRSTGTLTLSADSPDGVRLGTATLQVAIGDPLRVTATGDPVHAPPGLAPANLRIENAGGPADLALSALPPEGWRLVLPFTKFSLGAGQGRDLAAQVDIPPGTPPGDYTIGLLANGVKAGRLDVHVSSQPAWTSRIEAVRQLEDASEVFAKVTNIGNAAGVPDLGAGDGILVEPAATELQPGEAMVYRLLLQGKGSVADLRLPGAGTVALGVPDPQSAVELQSWELLPVAGARAGEPLTVRATLRNSGETIEPSVPVRVYEDGRLVAATQALLRVGQESTVSLTWVAAEGAHVVTVTAGADGEQAGQSQIIRVAPADHSIPAGSALAAFVVLIGAAIAWRRRR